jgi:hypothetical protein
MPSYDFDTRCCRCKQVLYTDTLHPFFFMIWCQEEDGFTDWPSGLGNARYCGPCYDEKALTFANWPLPVAVLSVEWHEDHRRYYPRQVQYFGKATP